jgi:DNA-binding CsgD family transcriptional regulator
MLDRHEELTAIRGLAAAARTGLSGALVLRGEPGVGMTTLLDDAMVVASDMRVIRITGIESEMQFPYAGVHQLCSPLLAQLDRLPAPQRNALLTAFGMREGATPEPFLASLAVLGLLASTAEERPVFALVDDAQWLDEASLTTLAFVARRIDAEGIAMIFAVQDPTDRRLPFEGLPERRVSGLDERFAGDLLSSLMSEPLDKDVRTSLIAGTGGNPLALVEVAGALSSDELAGRAPLPEPLPVGDRLEEAFLQEVAGLPPDAKTLLLLAASEPGRDPALLLRAAGNLDIGPEVATSLSATGLLRIDGQVSFRHPLVRSAVYRCASAAERRRAHEALARSVDEHTDPDQRAWHRAAAAAGPDEETAAEVERWAERARARGGVAAAGALLMRAAQLSSDPRQRARRSLEAARAEFAAGSLGRATALLSEATTQLVGQSDKAQALRLRGAIGFALGQGAETTAMILQAARTLEAFDLRQARDTYLEALEAAILSSPIGSIEGIREAAKAARSAARPPEAETTATDLLLDGIALLCTKGHLASMPTIRRAIQALRRDDNPRWLALGSLVALETWDDDGLHALASLQVALAQASNSLMILPTALAQLGIFSELTAGRFGEAKARFQEARELSSATGSPRAGWWIHSGELLLAACRGQEVETRQLAERCLRQAYAQGLGSAVAATRYSVAVLEVGMARYASALPAALAACENHALWVASQALPELVEAAVRSGKRELAVAAEARFARRAAASGTEWALGLQARCRALLKEGSEADGLYREAIERLQRTRALVHLGRAHLLYGEWLRRARRPREARTQLRHALEVLSSMGAEAFAERARIELSATGAHGTRRAVADSSLTPQEARIARLVGEGASNPQIAAQLFISRRTVEYHLSKIFSKLGVGSRVQLARLVLERPDRISG